MKKAKPRDRHLGCTTALSPPQGAGGLAAQRVPTPCSRPLPHSRVERPPLQMRRGGGLGGTLAQQGSWPKARAF